MAASTCAICNAEAAKKIRGEFSARYNQVPVTVPDVEMYECGSCGEQFFDPEQAKALSIAVKREVRRKAGLLAPEEIVAIRQRLKLSQTDLEELLGLGPKVVTRWETGRVVQSKTADVALRLLDVDPKNLERLRARRTNIAAD